jgi:CO/xanthine dehydrogenase Mo-binding subunit
VERNTLAAFNGEMWSEGINLRMSMEEAVHTGKKRSVVPAGSGAFTAFGIGLDRVDGSVSPWQVYVVGSQVAEVEVGTVTGEVQGLGIWAVQDVGRASNPRHVEGQIEGGVVQVLGQALTENSQLEGDRITMHSFAKYILPTSIDTPQINTVIVEDHDPESPLGAEGIGEPALLPPRLRSSTRFTTPSACVSARFLRRRSASSTPCRPSRRPLQIV